MTKIIQKKSSVISIPADGSLDFAQLGITQVNGVTKLYTGNVGGATNTAIVSNAEMLSSLLGKIGVGGVNLKTLGYSTNGGNTTFLNAVLTTNETTSPSATNDITQGFVSGSLWVNSVTSEIWSALDTSEGAAVWQKVSSSVTSPIQLKGSLDCSGNPNYPAAEVGWMYVVNVAGKIGGALGENVEIGDQILCLTTNAGGTQAAVGNDFTILQTNIANGVTSSSATSSIDNVVVMDSTNGRIIKDSGIAVNESSSANTLVQRNLYRNIEVNGIKQLALEFNNNTPVITLNQSDPTFIQIFDAVTGAADCVMTLPESTDADSLNREYTIVNYGNHLVTLQYYQDSDPFVITVLKPYQQLTIRNRFNEYSFGSLVNLDQRFSVVSQSNLIPVRDENKRLKANGIVNDLTTSTDTGAVFLFLTNSSNRYQELANQQNGEGDGIAMPNATTLPIGDTWTFFNNSDGGLEIYPYDNPPSPFVLYTIGVSQMIQLILTDNTTPAGNWKVILNSDSVIDGGTF